MRLSPSEIASRLNSSYWFVPLLVTLGGVILAFILLFLDARVAPEAAIPLAILRHSSAEGARALLSAVIGAMITALSVTFSVTIVALTVAAQHFGPRVLNNFVRQTSAQIVLGTFMATFVYSVLALGAIRGTGPDAHVPQLTVSGAVARVVLSIGALIFYVHHVSTVLQIGELAAAIGADLRHAVMRTDVGGSEGALQGTPDPPDAPPDAAPVFALESGYVQRIDDGTIVRAAAEAEAVVWIRREPGAFLVAGTPVALVHPPTACDDALVRTIRRACVVGRDRTLWHDPEFAVKQLVEIALRALSPGVNEPFTAMTCIDRLTDGLAAAATASPLGSGRFDDRGHVRVWVRHQPFVQLLRAGFDPIRIFAGPNPAIHARLLDSLGDLGLVARDADKRPLVHQADLVRRTAERDLADAEDVAYVQSKYELAMRQLAGKPASARD